MLDESGRARQLYELYDDRIVLLSFVYSSCLDVNACPLATAVMHKVRARLASEPALARQTRLVTLSFDPERDTPEVMRAYGTRDHGDAVEWSSLTTASKTQLDPILKAYDQSIQLEYDEEGRATGQLSHILRVFLIDRQKQIRNVYSTSFLHADIVWNDIRTLFLEREANGSRHRSSAPPRADLKRLAEQTPLGLPTLPVPASNPLTQRGIDLGRKLFFDRRLSRNGTISCAMCHIPDQGFTNHELATAVGIEGRTVRRNSPTLYNVAYAERLFHDGRETRLEQQVWGPLLAANEMGNRSVGSLLERIEALPDYAGLFEAAFEGRGLGMETLGMALASYQRTLVSANSPFDRWHFAGEVGAISESAERGFRLFSGEAACAACHPMGRKTALFTDHQMHNTGIGYHRSMGVRPGVPTLQVPHEVLASISETPPSDVGRYEITEDPGDRWKYKTPSLRNVTLTPPYMHDGSIRTLRAVVEFYNAGGIPNETLDPLIRPLGLSARDIDDLVAFLESLTGDSVELLVGDARSAPIGDPR